VIPPRDFGAEEAARQASFIDEEWTLITMNVVFTRWGMGDWQGWIQMGRPELTPP
jgi:hypothetical protein